MQLKDMGEFPFIRSIATDTVKDKTSVKVGIGDDCAVYSAIEGKDQLLTTDMMIEGVDFTFELMRPYDVGYRLTAANLSDIAAMGGSPKQLVVSVAAPKEAEVKDMQGVFDGIKAHCEEYQVNLVGGDMSSTSGPIVLSMTVVGEVPSDSAVLRSGAQPGDWVGVTNVLGSAATGLDVLSAGEKGYFVSKDAFQRPKAQIELGGFLRSQGVHAMNDISDGLAQELYEIAEASNVKIVIREDLLPIQEETKTWAMARGCRPSDYALYGGEDFQLVFTCSEAVKDTLVGHPLLTFIGLVGEGDPMVFLQAGEDEESAVLERNGYNHFAQ